MVRGIDGREIFLDDADRWDWLARVSRAFPEAEARCPAWSLMGNHAHFVIQTGSTPLSLVMHRINTGYAGRFNKRWERRGYVFQDRFLSRLVSDDADLVNLISYVHLNPVKARIVRRERELAVHPWSSYSALVGDRPAFPFESVSFALGLFDEDASRARRLIAESLEQRIEDAAEHPRPTFSALLSAVGKRLGATPDDLRSRSRFRRISRARAVVCHLAIDRYGLPAEHVAKELGISKAAVSQGRKRGRPITAHHERQGPISPTT